MHFVLCSGAHRRVCVSENLNVETFIEKYCVNIRLEKKAGNEKGKNRQANQLL